MIPKICANCEWGSNIVDADGNVQVVVCGYMPLAIAEYPAHTCGCFKMSENPQVKIEDSDER